MENILEQSYNFLSMRIDWIKKNTTSDCSLIKTKKLFVCSKVNRFNKQTLYLTYNNTIILCHCYKCEHAWSLYPRIFQAWFGRIVDIGNGGSPQLVSLLSVLPTVQLNNDLVILIWKRIIYSKVVNPIYYF